MIQNIAVNKQTNRKGKISSINIGHHVCSSSLPWWHVNEEIQLPNESHQTNVCPNKKIGKKSRDKLTCVIIVAMINLHAIQIFLIGHRSLHFTKFVNSQHKINFSRTNRTNTVKIRHLLPVIFYLPVKIFLKQPMFGRT